MHGSGTVTTTEGVAPFGTGGAYHRRGPGDRQTTALRLAEDGAIVLSRSSDPYSPMGAGSLALGRAAEAFDFRHERRKAVGTQHAVEGFHCREGPPLGRHVFLAGTSPGIETPSTTIATV